MKTRSPITNPIRSQDARENELVLTPGLALIRALARHEAWLDENKRIQASSRPIAPNLLTRTD
jgi:hypothetical protein